MDSPEPFWSGMSISSCTAEHAVKQTAKMEITESIVKFVKSWRNEQSWRSPGFIVKVVSEVSWQMAVESLVAVHHLTGPLGSVTDRQRSRELILNSWGGTKRILTR